IFDCAVRVENGSDDLLRAAIVKHREVRTGASAETASFMAERAVRGEKRTTVFGITFQIADLINIFLDYAVARSVRGGKELRGMVTNRFGAIGNELLANRRAEIRGS